MLWVTLSDGLLRTEKERIRRLREKGLHGHFHNKPRGSEACTMGSIERPEMFREHIGLESSPKAQAFRYRLCIRRASR